MKKFPVFLISFFISLFVFSSSSHATLWPTSIWEVRTGATAGNVNGCAFNNTVSNGLGTDYSQQAVAVSSATAWSTNDGLGLSSCTVNLSGATFGTNYVGNTLHCTAGTSWGITTTAWHTILSTGPNPGDLGILGPAGVANVLTSGTCRIGGACSLGSTLDDDMFEMVSASNTIWVASGTYSFGETVSVSAATCLANAPCWLYGYGTARGDKPNLSNRPLINMGGNNYVGSTPHLFWEYFSSSSTTATTFTGDLGGHLAHCTIGNTRAAAAGVAVLLGANAEIYDCNLFSLNGTALSLVATNRVVGNYIHNSATGALTNSAGDFFQGNVFESNKIGIGVTLTGAVAPEINSNTFYSKETPSDGTIALNFTGAAPDYIRTKNNVFYGYSTGTYVAANRGSNIEDYNDYFNNTVNMVNLSSGSNNIALAPVFGNVYQSTGGAAITGNFVLTDASANFTGIVLNQDILHIESCSGCTAGNYLITNSTSSTTLYVNNTMGVGSSVVYFVTRGHNFSIGPNLKAVSTPTALGPNTSNYMDLGSVQRQEPTCSSSDGSGTVFKVQGGKLTVQGGKVIVQ